MLEPSEAGERDKPSQCRAHRSPYRGEASSRSTTFSNACGESSLTKACTSSGVGSRPVKSSVARRISVILPAGGEGLRWASFCLPAVKASPSVLTHDLLDGRRAAVVWALLEARPRGAV